MEHMGKKLFRIRRRMGLSQEKLARQIGCSRITLGEMEKSQVIEGRFLPKVEDLFARYGVMLDSGKVLGDAASAKIQQLGAMLREHEARLHKLETYILRGASLIRGRN